MRTQPAGARMPPRKPPTSVGSAEPGPRPSPPPPPRELLVGAAEADITPPVGIELSGFVAREQPSTAVHDPLLARALYLQTHESRLLWIHADVIGFKSEWVARLATRIAGLGLSAQEFLISASHTHAGPPTMHLLECGEDDGSYLQLLQNQLVELAELAVKSARRAVMYGNHLDFPLSVDRRHQPSAHVDQQLAVLGFAHPVENPTEYLAVLANYPIHPVALGPQNREISGDVLGFAAEHLKNSLPGNPVVLFTNGACGNLNPPSRGGFEQTRLWGIELAEAAISALESGHYMPGHPASVGRTTMVPTQDLSGSQLDARVEALTRLFEGDESTWNVRSRKALERWEERMHSREPGPMELELQVVRIGEYLFVCIGAEVFSVMSERLRHFLGPRVQVVGYASGNIGYLCPSEAYDEGGYEVESAFMYYGTPPIAPGAFEAVQRKLIAMAETLR